VEPNGANVGASAVSEMFHHIPHDELRAMKSPSADQSGKKATFDFYNGFLTVVYGLLVSKGLEYVVTFTSDHPTHQFESIDAFLFLGTFFTSLHFWFVCATVDDLSTDFYQTLVGRKASFLGLFILIDVVVATFLAGLLLAMFDAVPNPRFFFWFLLAAAVSFGYDLYSRLLVFWAAKMRGRNIDSTSRYRVRINGWIKKDFIFLSGSGLLYLSIAHKVIHNSIGFSSIFALFTVCLLLMDVCSFQRNGRNILGPVDSRGPQTDNST
jgi:hypothetical protein